MRFAVRLTPDALADLEEIHDWIAVHDSPGRAAQVEDQILAAVAALARLPVRGAHPRELLALGIRAYRDLLQAVSHSLRRRRKAGRRLSDRRRQARLPDASRPPPAGCVKNRGQTPTRKNRKSGSD